MTRAIRFYRTESGRSPIEDFLDGLTAQQAQRVAWVLRLIEELDKVPGQYFRKMTGTEEIWEARAKAGPETFRFLGFFDGPHLIVLNHAFSKKSRKTPPAAIRLAQERRRDYLQRKTDE